MPENDTARAELAKRYSAAHKMSLGKVNNHLAMCKSAHAKGMASLAKAAGCMVDAKKLGKAADGDALAAHISAAHDHFNTASDHMDDMTAHLGQAMSAWGHSTNVDPSTEVGGKINIPGLSELTEGDVPWYDSAGPYGEKIAKAVQELLAKNGYVPRDQAEKMVKDAEEKATAAAKAAGLEQQVAALNKQVELLSRQPSGNPKIRTFDFEKSPLPGMTGGQGEGGSKLSKLLDGVDMDKLNDRDGFNDVAAKMIGNMIGDRLNGGTTFAKNPIFDPTFRGAAGRGSGRAARN